MLLAFRDLCECEWEALLAEATTQFFIDLGFGTGDKMMP